MSVETFTCLMNGSFYEGDPPLPSPQLSEKSGGNEVHFDM